MADQEQRDKFVGKCLFQIKKFQVHKYIMLLEHNSLMNVHKNVHLKFFIALFIGTREAVLGLSCRVS